MNEKEQLIDRYTHIDELLAEMLSVLRSIARPSSDGEVTLKDIYELLEKQSDKNYEIFSLTYPNDGTRATFTAGTTTLDFAAGTIKAPDGTVDRMSTSLREQKKDFMGSLIINCDQEVVVQLDEDDKSPVRANTWTKLTYQQFTKVYVTATVSTTGYVYACTNPDTINDQIGQTTIAVGKQTITHVDTDKDSRFTTAIAQNAIEEENITGLSDNKITITGIAFQAKEALNYRLWIFGTDGFADADLDADQSIKYVDFDFATANGQIAGAGQYYLAQTDLSIDYEDEDATNELHLALQNLSVAAKTAGAAGAIKVKVSYKPRM